MLYEESVARGIEKAASITENAKKIMQSPILREALVGSGAGAAIGAGTLSLEAPKGAKKHYAMKGALKGALVGAGVGAGAGYIPRKMKGNKLFRESSKIRDFMHGRGKWEKSKGTKEAIKTELAQFKKKKDKFREQSSRPFGHLYDLISK